MDTATKSSRLAGFYKQSLDERIGQVARWANLTADETAALRGAMGLDRADRMIENVVGPVVFQVPQVSCAETVTV